MDGCEESDAIGDNNEVAECIGTVGVVAKPVGAFRRAICGATAAPSEVSQSEKESGAFSVELLEPGGLISGALGATAVCSTGLGIFCDLTDCIMTGDCDTACRETSACSVDRDVSAPDSKDRNSGLASAGLMAMPCCTPE